MDDNRRMILCGGLQSGGTTIISWCLLQRRDTDGVLDMANSIIRTDFSAARQPVLWVKMTIGAFRYFDVYDCYRDLGWQPAPLLVVREARTAFASLMGKDYGINGTTAEDPPLRMRFRRFLQDWKFFRERGWPIVRFEDFIADPLSTLRSICNQLRLEWDEAMVNWPKSLRDLAYVAETNRTFAETIARGSLAAALNPSTAEYRFDKLPRGEMKWLDEEFSEYNRVCGYPATLEYPAGVNPPAAMDAPAFDWTSRHWFLSELQRLNGQATLERAGRGQA